LDPFIKIVALNVYMNLSLLNRLILISETQDMHV
jgi:hypothetical protein